MNQATQKLREQIVDEQRQRNRAQMPGLAALMDELSSQFPGCKLLYGEEVVEGQARTIGNRPHEPNAFTIPAGYAPCKATAEIIKGIKNGSKA